MAIAAACLLTGSCKKEKTPATTTTAQVPVLITTPVSNITSTTATSGGNITSDGGVTVTARGVCWSTGQTPSTTDSKTTDGTGAGCFTSVVTGLTSGTAYYMRAYATNSAGTGYGSAMSLTTTTTTSSEIIFNPNLIYGTVIDIDNNIYKTMKQCKGNSM